MGNMIVVFDDGDSWVPINDQHPPHVLSLTDDAYERVVNQGIEGLSMRDIQNRVLITKTLIYKEIERGLITED